MEPIKNEVSVTFAFSRRAPDPSGGRRRTPRRHGPAHTTGRERAGQPPPPESPKSTDPRGVRTTSITSYVSGE